MARESTPRAVAAPRRLVLADGTYDAIKAMILDHEISPGEHVGIDELARDLSVSQTPVREALARLEADGLVTKIPLRGYEATDLLSVQEVDELFQFRSLIDSDQSVQSGTFGEQRDAIATFQRTQRIDRLARHSQCSL